MNFLCLSFLDKLVHYRRVLLNFLIYIETYITNLGKINKKEHIKINQNGQINIVLFHIQLIF